MHDMEFNKDLKAIARAGAGVNNIPVDRCADLGIVVFNTPGANANAVKELVIAGLLLASRDIVGGIEWVKANVADPAINKTAEKAKELDTGMHAHLCEHKDEVSFCLTNYKMRPAELLNATGCLTSDLLTAHNVVLSEGDIKLLAEKGVGVIHCPRSNLSNHGFPKTPRMLEEGISIGLGSDGACTSSLSLWDEVKVLRNGLIAYWGLPIFDPVVIPYKSLLRMMSQGGADACRLGDKLGSVEEGKLADIILLNINRPHILPTHNLAATLVESANAGDVVHSIINGKIVMKNREILTMDEEKIMWEAQKTLESVSAKAGFTL